ncbi:MAG: hypothetical protein KGZ58_12020 [Ignavibacteriales bacterium]|nr:hypothetical protein [Ignavibacteriales bacterium]
MKHKHFLFVLFLILISIESHSQEKILRDRFEDAFKEVSENKLTLRFFNAINGKGIPNANVNIEKIGDFTTDDEGAASFPVPEEDGVYNVSFRAAKYISSDFTIEIMAGTIFFNRYSISPQLDIRHLRVVVDWDEEPRDIDAHFIKTNGYHISYRDMKTTADGVGTLDRDDVDSYGPETITIKEISNNTSYEYFIHDYSNQSHYSSTKLSQSKATVKVFGEGKLLNVFQIPLNQKGTVWHVFKIEQGAIVEVKKISNE